MSEKSTLLAKIEQLQDTSGFRGQHWEGTFEDYLEIVRQDPRVARTAFQRLYDMIVSYGSNEYTRYRETLIHYNFFEDPFENGKDAIFGLDKPLFGLRNPGIVSIPLGFLSAIVFALLFRRKEEEDAFDELYVRQNTGVGIAKAMEH